MYCEFYFGGVRMSDCGSRSRASFHVLRRLNLTPTHTVVHYLQLSQDLLPD